MYAYFKGILTTCSAHDLILEIGGIGYRILIPANIYGTLPGIGEEIQLHTSFIVRENVQALYGFLSMQDRDLFEALISVTGIGPKLGLSIIGHLSLEQMHYAIQHHEVTMLSKVPGIGKKTAERLIIELRDKLPAFIPIDPASFAIHAKVDPQTLLINDAMSALINLGYNQNIAQKAIKKTLKDTPQDIDLATLITISLKNV